MNSAQRRRARREYPHIVKMSADRHRRYFEHDAEVDRAAKWCRKQFGSNGWRLSEGWSHTVFKFARERDAAFFALKWS